MLLTNRGSCYIVEKRQFDSKKNSSEIRIGSRERCINLGKEKIVNIACGRFCCYAVTNEGKLFFWGDPEWASSCNDCDLKFFKQVDMQGKKIIFVDCCRNSTMVCTVEGELYARGDNSHRKLGVKSPDMLRKFTRVPNIKVKVSPFLPMEVTVHVPRNSRGFSGEMKPLMFNVIKSNVNS